MTDAFAAFGFGELFLECFGFPLETRSSESMDIANNEALQYHPRNDFPKLQLATVIAEPHLLIS
jgi:hypothetical protein